MWQKKTHLSVSACVITNGVTINTWIQIHSFVWLSCSEILNKIALKVTQNTNNSIDEDWHDAKMDDP